MSIDYSSGTGSGLGASLGIPSISPPTTLAGSLPKFSVLEPAPPRTLPEKIDLNQIVSGLTGSSVSLMGQVGMAPGRITEMPISLVDTVGKRLVGESIVDNVVNGVSKIPFVGNVLTGLSDFLNSGYKFVGSVLNSGMARALRETANLPDSAPFTGSYYDTNLELSPMLPQLLGVDLVGHLLGWKGGIQLGPQKTVGDLRSEARARGFTDQDIADLAAGKRSDFSFSDPLVTTDPMLDMATRMVLDPTNILLFTPAAVARGAAILSKGDKLFKAAQVFFDALRGGRVAEAAPDALRAAQAIQEGNTASATLKGLGTFLQRASRAGVAYRNLAVKTSVGVVATDLASEWLQQLAPRSPLSPALEGLHQFASDVINDHPLSDNAAWSFTMAGFFPVNEYLQKVRGPISAAKKWAIGDTNFTNTLARKAFGDASPTGGVAKLRAALGGQEGIDEFHNYITMLVARDKMAATARDLVVASTKAPETSVEGAMVAALDRLDALAVNRNALMARGAISDKDVFDKVADWYRTGGVVGDTAARTPIERPLQTKADWQDLIRTWVEYRSVQPMVSKLYYERGIPVAMGLRAGADLPVESLQTIWNTAKAAVVKGRVPADVMRDIVNRWPGLGSGLDAEWWQKFVLPNAPDVGWSTLSRKLKQAMKDPTRPTIKEATGGFAAHEAAAPDAPVAAEPLSNPMPQPAATLAARRARMDAAWRPNDALPPSPTDVELDGIYQKAIGDLAPGWQREHQLTQEHLDELTALQDQLDRRLGGRYTLKPAPTDQVVAEFDPQLWGRTAVVMRERNALASWLLDWGLTSPAARILGWLASPVEGARMAEAARQAFLNEVVPRGASPEAAARFWSRLQEDVRTHTYMGTRVPTSRSVEALSPNTIDALAFGPGGVFRDNKKLQEALQRDRVTMTNLVDRAASRTYRAIQQQLREDHGPGRLGRALDAFFGKAESAYEKTQTSPVGAGLRIVTRQFYYFFRFIADVRWWAMNAQEADWIGGAVEGLKGTQLGGAEGRLPSQATVVHALGEQRAASTATKLEEAVLSRLPGGEYDMPMLMGRRLTGRVARIFDAQRPATVVKVLDSLPESDPVIHDLVKVLGPERESWAKQLDDWMYSADQKGVGKAITERAAEVLTPEEANQMSVLLTRLKEVNQQLYDSIAEMFYGNPNRTNMERILNNYLLYWPISYQLKATRWLWRVMTERMGGQATNALGAMKYAEMEQQHKQLLATDPRYVAIFAQHPSLWLLAQMMFPVTPEDLGVSLSRPVRYLGGALGIWPVYKAAEDPASFVQMVTELGPLYTAKLLNQVVGEFQPQRNFQNALTDLYAALDVAEASGDEEQIKAVKGLIAETWSQIDQAQQGTNAVTLPVPKGTRRQTPVQLAP